MSVHKDDPAFLIDNDNAIRNEIDRCPKRGTTQYRVFAGIAPLSKNTKKEGLFLGLQLEGELTLKTKELLNNAAILG